MAYTKFNKIDKYSDKTPVAKGMKTTKGELKYMNDMAKKAIEDAKKREELEELKVIKVKKAFLTTGVALGIGIAIVAGFINADFKKWQKDKHIQAGDKPVIERNYGEEVWPDSDLTSEELSFFAYVNESLGSEEKGLK